MLSTELYRTFSSKISLAEPCSFNFFCISSQARPAQMIFNDYCQGDSDFHFGGRLGRAAEPGNRDHDVPESTTTEARDRCSTDPVPGSAASRPGLAAASTRRQRVVQHHRRSPEHNYVSLPQQCQYSRRPLAGLGARASRQLSRLGAPSPEVT